MRKVVLALGFALLVRRLLLVVRVTGNSMRPSYSDGDVLLAARLPLARRGRPVVFTPPKSVRYQGDPPYRVKRVAAVAGDRAPEWLPGARPGEHVPPGRIVVRGDAQRSEDSRRYGYVLRQDVLAVVLFRISRANSPAKSSTR